MRVFCVSAYPWRRADGSDIERIAEPLIDQHILKGDIVGEPNPEVLALNGGLNPSMINKLFIIENCDLIHHLLDRRMRTFL